MITKLRTFIKKCRTKKIFFFITFIVVFSLLLRHEGTKKPVYQIKSRIKIQNSFGINPVDSRILQEVYDRLDAQGRRDRPTVIAQLREELSVASDTSSGLMEIMMSGTTPRWLTKTVNTVTEVYVEAINHEAGRLKEDHVRKKELEIEDYKVQLQEQLAKAKADLEEYENKIEEFRSREEESNEAFNALKAEFAELEFERSELLRFYTPYHPDVIRIDIEIDELKKKIKAAPIETTGKLTFERELQDRQKAYTTIKDKLDEINIKKIEELQDIKGGEATILSLAKDPSVSGDMMKKKFTFLMIIIVAMVAALLVTIATIIFDKSLLMPDEVYAFTNLPVAGIIPAIRPRALQGTRLKKKTALLLGFEHDIKIIEPYKRLYFYIQSHIFGEQPESKSILLTSSISQEGKSLTASNLALVMAKAGKRVCLIDAHYARPSVHLLFGIVDKAPGLTDILNKSVTLDDGIRDVTDMLLGNMGLQPTLQFKGLDRLKLITVGSPIPDISGLLRSDEMVSLMAELKPRFDCIVLDGPPVSAHDGSLILAPRCDATFMVYLTGKTPKTKLKSALLHQSRAVQEGGMAGAATNIEGVIVNKCI
jgi:Mrp family chromosome partitioning ATPase